MEDQDNVQTRQLHVGIDDVCRSCFYSKSSICDCLANSNGKLGNDNAKRTPTELELEERIDVKFASDADIGEELRKKMPDAEKLHNFLDDIRLTTRDEVSADKNISSTSEIHEIKVEGLSIGGSTKFADEANVKDNDANYKEMEKINKGAKKKDVTQLNNESIWFLMGTEEATENEKDEWSEKNDEIRFPCPSCKRDLPMVGKGFTVNLNECRHTLCRWCMTELLKNIITDIAVEPRCPIIDGLIRCNTLIQEHQIRDLVDPILYEEYLEKSIVKIKEDPENRILHCQTPTCEAWYIMEDDNLDSFLCTLCKNVNYVDKKAYKKPEETMTDTEKYMQSERYNEILLLSESGIVPNFEPFECPICFVQYEPQEGLILKNCLHTFCKVCITNVILYSEDADIKCPYKNDDYSCDENILQSEIRAVLKPEDFQKYLQKSVAEAERKAGKSAFHCMTPNCPDWCFYEPGVDHFLCPTCNEDNCFLCQKIHTGRGCVDDILPNDTGMVSKKSEALIEIMLQNKDALLCPTCNAVITKIDGCDAVICASCKTDICWVTRGPRWGPKGKYDKSGGCRCEPYARCHPLCRNCH